MTTGLHVAVTGASGFVGRHLVPALEDAGHRVTRVVRRPTSAGDVAIGSITNEVDPTIFSNQDAVVHLAAIAHRRGPEDFFAINRDGAVNIARAAAQAGVKHFVFMSTAKVLGEFTVEPLGADAPLNPPDDYSLAKAQAEAAIVAELGGHRTTIVRPPLVYGVGMLGNLGTLIHWLQKGRPIPVPSRANRRSMVSATSLGQSVVATLRTPPTSRRVIHPHDSATISFEETVRAMAAGLRAHPRLVSVPAVALEVLDRITSIAGKELFAPLLRDFELLTDEVLLDLGWTPSDSPKGGLERIAPLHSAEFGRQPS